MISKSERAGMCLAFADLLQEQLAPLKQRIADLEHRGYKGPYQRACSYRKHDAVTIDGVRCECIQDCGPNTIPGQSPHWQLSDRLGQHERRKSTQPRTLHNNQA